MESTFVTVQSRGTLALPKGVRERHHLDEPGAQVEVVEREDGIIELRPHVAVPSDQLWFWRERWQKMEAEADADVAAGRTRTHDSPEDFMAHLDALEAE